ncbi:hypothetical protein EIN_167220, partial [Entamoeba invadens IP1]
STPHTLFNSVKPADESAHEKLKELNLSADNTKQTNFEDKKVKIEKDEKTEIIKTPEKKSKIVTVEKLEKMEEENDENNENNTDNENEEKDEKDNSDKSEEKEKEKESKELKTPKKTQKVTKEKKEKKTRTKKSRTKKAKTEKVDKQDKFEKAENSEISEKSEVSEKVDDHEPSKLSKGATTPKKVDDKHFQKVLKSELKSLNDKCEEKTDLEDQFSVVDGAETESDEMDPTAFHKVDEKVVPEFSESVILSYTNEKYVDDFLSETEKTQLSVWGRRSVKDIVFDSEKDPSGKKGKTFGERVTRCDGFVIVVEAADETKFGVYVQERVEIGVPLLEENTAFVFLLKENGKESMKKYSIEKKDKNVSFLLATPQSKFLFEAEDRSVWVTKKIQKKSVCFLSDYDEKNVAIKMGKEEEKKKEKEVKRFVVFRLEKQ